MMNIEYVPFSFLCNLKYTEMFCAVIEPRIRTQDSYDKSLVVSDQDQIQYQICSTLLIHPPRLPYLPRLQQVPVRILHVGQDEPTVNQVATSAILTSHVPHCRASRGLEDLRP